MLANINIFRIQFAKLFLKKQLVLYQSQSFNSQYIVNQQEYQLCRTNYIQKIDINTINIKTLNVTRNIPETREQTFEEQSENKVYLVWNRNNQQNYRYNSQI